MSTNHKYFYLKLKDNFFDKEEVKVIKGIDKGDTYVCIMLELYLRSLKRGGLLMMSDTIPYELSTLASVLSRPMDEVKFAVDIFAQYGLIEVLDNGSMYMTDIENFIGKSTTEADRKRLHRKRIDDDKTAIGTNVGQISTKDRVRDRERVKDITTQPTEKNEKVVVVITLWNKLFSTDIKVDPSLERVVGKVIQSYGLQETKTIVNKYHFYLTDPSCWINQKKTIFDFMNSTEWVGKMFHATNETYLNTVKVNGAVNTITETGGFE